MIPVKQGSAELMYEYVVYDSRCVWMEHGEHVQDQLIQSLTPAETVSITIVMELQTNDAGEADHSVQLVQQDHVQCQDCLACVLSE